MDPLASRAEDPSFTLTEIHTGNKETLSPHLRFYGSPVFVFTPQSSSASS
jgi:hypothetical protein